MVVWNYPDIYSLIHVCYSFEWEEIIYQWFELGHKWLPLGATLGPKATNNKYTNGRHNAIGRLLIQNDMYTSFELLPSKWIFIHHDDKFWVWPEQTITKQYHVFQYFEKRVTSLINPLRAKFFRGNIKIYLHYVISSHWYNAGNWDPPSNRTRTYLFYIVNIVAADVLAT